MRSTLQHRQISLCIRAVLLGSTALAAAGAVSAAIITVDSTADAYPPNTSDGNCTLREAIVSANNDAASSSACVAGSGADTIAFDPTLAHATISLAGNQLSVADNTTMTIDGSDQSIDAMGLSRVLEVGVAANLTASNLTLTGGRVAGSSFGGGILVSIDALLSLTNVVIDDNTAADSAGGGISAATGSTVALASSVISNNYAKNRGGGIFLSTDAILGISDTTISNNVAAEDNGGGIFGFANNAINIVDSSMSGNTAEVGGGALYVFEGPVTVSNSTISGNDAGSSGGGLQALDGSVVEIHNSTISNNTAAGRGGGIAAYMGGNGITVNLENTILSANTAPTGTDLTTDGMAGTDVIVASGLLGTALQAGFAGNGNVFSDMPGLGPLQDNGGPTDTMLPQPSSLVIDAGDNTLLPPGLTTDQRGPGYPRIVGGIVDIGAVEAEGAPPPPSVSTPVPVSAPWALALLGALLGYFGLRHWRTLKF